MPHSTIHLNGKVSDTTENISLFFDGFKPKELIYNIKKNEDKFKATNRIVLDYLDFRKGAGATTSELAEATGLDRNTITKHLTYLVATRQAYKINESAGVYHKNGRIVHYKNMSKKIFEKKLYTFFQLSGPYNEEYVYIQEKEIGKLQTVAVKGGIVIDKAQLPAFINELTDFSKEIWETKT